MNIVVGQNHCLNIRLTNDGTILDAQGSITGKIILENPTMFFPDSLANSGLTEIYNYSLTRENDSEYNFSFDYTLTNKANILEFSLCGLALAGNDSLSKIYIHNLTPIFYHFEDKEITLKSTSIGGELPYLRMPILWDIYPNPVRPIQEVTCKYRIDNTQHIIFKIFDFQGKMISEFDLGDVSRGTHNFTFMTNYYYSSGVYILQLETKKHKLNQKFLIIK